MTVTNLPEKYRKRLRTTKLPLLPARPILPLALPLPDRGTLSAEADALLLVGVLFAF